MSPSCSGLFPPCLALLCPDLCRDLEASSPGSADPRHMGADPGPLGLRFPQRVGMCQHVCRARAENTASCEPLPAPPHRWDHEITASPSPPLTHGPAPSAGTRPGGSWWGRARCPAGLGGPGRQLAPLRCKQENGRMKIARGQEAALSRLRAPGSHPPPPAAAPPGVPVRFQTPPPRVR